MECYTVKKHLAKTAFILSVASALVCPKVMAVTLDPVKYDKTTGNITVSGKAEKAGTIVLHITASENTDNMSDEEIQAKTVKFETEKTESDGSFGITFNLDKTTDKEGIFFVRAAANDEKTAQCRFSAYSLETMEDILNKAKKLKNTEEAVLFIKQNYNIFVTDEEALLGVTKVFLDDSGVCNESGVKKSAEILLTIAEEKEFASDSNRLEADLFKSAAICAMNDNENLINTVKLIEMLGLERVNAKAYGYFEKLSDEAKIQMFKTISEKENKFKIADDFYKEWEWQTLRRNIGTVYGSGGQEAVLKNYKNRLDFSIYESAGNDRTAVISDIVNNIKNGTVRDFETLQAALDKIKKSNTQSGSAGGGGGGSSSGGYKGFKPSSSDAVDSENVKSLEPSPSFDDIESVPWAKESILRLAQIGIINGISENEFGPSLDVTRAQFAKILCGCFGIQVSGECSEFKDVDNGEWYAEYVAALEKRGIVNGREDNIFAPHDNVTRQDMAVMVYNAGKELFGEPQSGIEAFSDKDDISDYAAGGVAVLSKLGIINGMPDSSFAPKNNATRAEAAKLMDSVEKYVKKYV